MIKPIPYENRRFRCKIGIHKWNDPNAVTRTCICCGEVQVISHL